MHKQRPDRQEPKWNRKVLIILIIVLMAGIGIFVSLQIRRGDTKSEGFGAFWREKETDQGIGQTIGSNVFSVYGITAVDTLEVAFPVKGMDTSLEIAEVYINTGDTVASDTAILKFTEESVNTLKEELEAACREKELDYRAAKIEYEQDMITNTYEEQIVNMEGKQAETVYQETVSTLASEVERTKEALEEARQKYADYEAAVTDNAYYEAYSEAQATYDEDLTVLKEKMEEWGVEWSEITRGVRENYSTLHDQYVTILSQYYSVLEYDLKELEETRSVYEEAISTLPNEMEILRLSIPGLEADYAGAQKNYETQILEAKLVKEQSSNKAELAAKEYETKREKAKTDFENKEENYQDAVEALKTFQEYVRDGIMYAPQSGTIIRNNVRAGKRVTTDSELYTISQSESMTITASVGQEEIARIAVGDTAMVVSEEGGTYSAEIESINPIAAEERGTVAYSVILNLTGDFSNLSGNETVIVYFGMGGTQE